MNFYRTIILIAFLSLLAIRCRPVRGKVKTAELVYENGIESVQDLSKYLQPDDVLSGKYDYTSSTDYQCARDCKTFQKSRLCYYKFVLEQYHTMGPACDGCPEDEKACYATHCVVADGLEKMILTVNRRLCSPAIMVCQGDRIVIDVTNKMPGRTTSIHAHGVHFKGFQWMDGTSYVTQCPIIEGQTFRYEFPMEQVGDFYYHSHDAIQMTDGLQGALISRPNRPWHIHSSQYDEDLFSHTMFVQDWMHFPTDDKVPGYNKVKSKTGFETKTFLINGHGSFKSDDGTETDSLCTVFRVVAGKRYRFRIISSVNSIAVLTFEDHDFKLISADADPIRPIPGASLFLTSGERFSIVILANRKPKSYWIQVKAKDADAVQYAILRYVNADYSDMDSDTTPLIPQTKRPLDFRTPILNDVTGNCDPANTADICAEQFVAMSPAASALLAAEPDYRLFLKPSFHYFTSKELYSEGKYYKHYLPYAGPSLGGGMYSDMYNNVTAIYPPFSMLTQNNPFPQNTVCTEKCFKPDTFCECTPLYKIPLDAVVEIVIIDETYDGEIYHSHHLHGHSFRVIKQGSVEEIKNNPKFFENIMPKGYTLYPLKDTINVPFNGYVVIRFWATNQGLWLLHCHVSNHAHMGMSLVLQVGERSRFPKPPTGFPTCGNFIPDAKLPQVL